MPLLAQARSYAAALSLARQGSRNDPDALDERVWLASVCNEQSSESRRARLSSSETTNDARESARFLLAFCNTAAEPIEPLMEALASHSDADIVSATNLHEAHHLDANFARDEALRLLTESQSARALEAVDRFLEEATSLQLALEPIDESPPLGVDQRQVLSLAIRMIACEQSRSCGADSVNAWLACASVRMCRPGISMDQIWRASTAPIVYESALRRANQLRQLRSSALRN